MPPCVRVCRRLLALGEERLGYDLGTATSLGLIFWSAPQAATNSAHTALATIAGLSAAANGIKSYQVRCSCTPPHDS